MVTLLNYFMLLNICSKFGRYIMNGFRIILRKR